MGDKSNSTLYEFVNSNFLKELLNVFYSAN